MRYLSAFLLCTASMAYAQNDVIVPWTGTPFADGQVEPGEWDLDHSILVPAGGGNSCLVAVAADSWGLYLAYMGHLESAGLLPEVLLDLAHDQTTGWNADDHWFHVSATCCHHQGAYGVFDDCTGLPIDWSGHPLVSAGPPVTDTIEVAIPWYYLGITPEPGDTIGFCAVLTNTATVWNEWPASADRDAPGTWGHLVFPDLAAIGELHQLVTISVSPVPSSGEVSVHWSGVPGPARRIAIIDAAGRVVMERRGAMGAGVLIGGLRNGTYTASVEFDDHRTGRARLVVVP